MNLFDVAKNRIEQAQKVEFLDAVLPRLQVLNSKGKLSEEELAELSALIAKRRTDMNGA